MEITDHDRIVGMHKDVGYIKEKIKSLCRKIEGVDERVDKLESWKDRVHIIFAGLGVGVGSAWAKLMKML